MGSHRRHAKLLRRARMCDKLAGKPRFRLLDLPHEIRALILRELLWDPEPLFWNPNQSYGLWWVHAEGEYNWFPSTRGLHPAILSVCRQLYREGHPILYDNTIRCVVGLDRPEPKQYDYCPVFVRRGKRYEILRNSRSTVEDNHESLPQGLRQSIRKLDVQIVVPKLSFDDSRPNFIPRWLTESIQGLKNFLQAHDSYQHLSFKLHFPWDAGEKLAWEQGHDDSDTPLSKFRNTLRRQLFTPLCMLRNRSSIVFYGIYPETARQMRMMLTSEPVVDLEAMGELVRETPLSLYGISHYAGDECSLYVDRVRSECYSSATEGRLDDFIAARTKLMTLIALMSANGIRHMHRLDSHTKREFPKWKYLTLGESLEEVAAILNDAPKRILDIAEKCAQDSCPEGPKTSVTEGQDSYPAFFSL